MDSTYDVKKIFGYNLKNLRESKGLTQEQLAEYLNLQTYTLESLDKISEINYKLNEIYNIVSKLKK